MSVPQRLTSILALAMALAATACEQSPTNAARAPDAPAMATNVSTVCKGTSVPTGYVILSYTYHYTCGSSSSGYPTAMSIGLPGSSETVCDTSPIPSGYVITSYVRKTNCDAYSTTSASYKNADSIKIPTATYEYVCSGSPIPSNYTTTSYSYFTSSCDRYGNSTGSWPNAERIQKL